MNFITLLVEEKLINILGNDDIEEEYKAVSNTFPRLTITDCIQLSTAMKHNCGLFKTLDKDILGITNKKGLNDLAQSISGHELRICKS